jgi:hypothetical protein
MKMKTHKSIQMNMKTRSKITKRGFASMSPERRRETAMGGKAVPDAKQAFSLTKSREGWQTRQQAVPVRGRAFSKSCAGERRALGVASRAQAARSGKW